MYGCSDRKLKAWKGPSVVGQSQCAIVTTLEVELRSDWQLWLCSNTHADARCAYINIIETGMFLLIHWVSSSRNTGTPMDKVTEGLSGEVISKFRENLGDINFGNLQSEVVSPSFCVSVMPRIVLLLCTVQWYLAKGDSVPRIRGILLWMQLPTQCKVSQEIKFHWWIKLTYISLLWDKCNNILPSGKVL